jgi:hypothetical protein
MSSLLLSCARGPQRSPAVRRAEPDRALPLSSLRVTRRTEPNGGGRLRAIFSHATLA